MRRAQEMDEQISVNANVSEHSPPNWETIGERIRRAACVAATVHLIEEAGASHRLITGVTAKLETSLQKPGE